MGTSVQAPTVENIEEVDIFADSKGKRDTGSSIDLIVSLEIPNEARDRIEKVDFEMSLPSMDEIRKLKRRKFNQTEKSNAFLGSKSTESKDFPKDFSLYLEEPESMMYRDG